jgi:hypothetical protein
MMIFKSILLCTYLLLKSALKMTSFMHPRFEKRLMERDLAFVVGSSIDGVAGLFRLEGGSLSYSGRIDGSVDFSAFWNGWGDADTLAKKLRLNPMDYMNTGIMTFEGDLSSMDYLLVLLGEMVGSFKKKRRARLERAELGRRAS